MSALASSLNNTFNSPAAGIRSFENGSSSLFYEDSKSDKLKSTLTEILEDFVSFYKDFENRTLPFGADTKRAKFEFGKAINLVKNSDGEFKQLDVSFVYFPSRFCMIYFAEDKSNDYSIKIVNATVKGEKLYDHTMESYLYHSDRDQILEGKEIKTFLNNIYVQIENIFEKSIEEISSNILKMD